MLFLSATNSFTRALSLRASFSTRHSRAGVMRASTKSSGRSGPPLVETFAVHQVIARRLRRVEQVAVSMVLVLLAPGIAPIIEDLAAKQVTAHPPGMAVAFRHQHLLTHFHRVEVDDLEGHMVDLRFHSHGNEDRVVIGRFVAAIQARERAHRRAVGEAHHIGRDETEHVHVPAHTAVEVRRLDDEVCYTC